MINYLLSFVLILALAAIALRADFALTLVYLLLGAYAASRFWSRQALASISTTRVFNRRAFLGEVIPVQLEIRNNSLLPVIWLRYHEKLPLELAQPAFQHRVISLSGKERFMVTYALEARRRGYYPVGPLELHTGDVFGMSNSLQMTVFPDHLTVYPKIIPFTQVQIPSHSPLGTLRHREPLFEDPSRVSSKRDYTTGDSLRRIDWKSSAASGRLQVKLFEPSIALETAILLNLNAGDFGPRDRYAAAELAIIVAASLANWVVGKRQSVGLITNGADPLQEGAPPLIPPRRGRGHLMRILDLLARVETGEAGSFIDLVQRAAVQLAWGTTLIVISPDLGEPLFDALFQARRTGLNAVLAPCGPVPGLMAARRRAEHFRFPLVHILRESDLDIWRK